MDNDNLELPSSFSTLLGTSTEVPLHKGLGKEVSIILSQLQDNEPDALYGALPALFDLFVTATYLTKAATSGWYYCDHGGTATAVYPFVNACPQCSLRGEFHFVKARKPRSSTIGGVTSTVLTVLISWVTKQQEPSSRMFTVSGSGPVDAFLLFRDAVVLFEIKSSPLIAFPVVAAVEDLTELDVETDEPVHKPNHSETHISPHHECELVVSKTLRIPIGNAHHFAQGNHFELIRKWLLTDTNLADYVASWQSIFAGYTDEKVRDEMYWFTNGCGAPKPRPASWPARRGASGFEQISDGKSAIGMDRTDDLKKGIYQVLKISTHFKEFFVNNSLRVFSVLASNVHAVKHYDDYIAELKDIVWTIDSEEKPYVSPLDDGSFRVAEDKLYNLFDGIYTLTMSDFRVAELKDLFLPHD